jgi:type III restriction enzyme
VTDPFPLATALQSVLKEPTAAITSGSPTVLLESVSPVTAELLRFWFQTDYCDLRELNFHRGQREAILSIIYAHEVLGVQTLMDLYQHVAPQALLETGVLGEVSGPLNNHPKYAAKMATGTGKTWVLNALLVWQYLNHIDAPLDRRFTNNFLIVAPGLIVYDRLLDSFLGKEREGARHFVHSDLYLNRDLFVPDDMREAIFNFLQTSVTTKADIGRKVTSGGLVAITNWHLLAGVEDPSFLEEVEAPGLPVDAKGAVESFFPITPGTATGNSLDQLDRAYARGGPLKFLRDLPSLVVFNDEAHHIHEMAKGGEVLEVEWQRSLTDIAAPKGHRFLQIDFSATPFNEVGTKKARRKKFFPHIVVDFNLEAAMSAGLVKALALDKRKEIATLPLDFKAERDEFGNVLSLSQGQRVMLRAGLRKLEILEENFRDVDSSKYPKILVVCEDTAVTPHVVDFLISTGLQADEILRIDSNRKGEMSQLEWSATRERLFDVDSHAVPKVIVSVLMLREGFDVNNICVIVPLRSSQAQILLEQTIGRGLRLMWRGDARIDEAKKETRERFKKRLEPSNFFDVLFIVEHPAFAAFYDDLLDGGLAGEVSDTSDKIKPAGDIEVVGLKDDYEMYDFVVPFIVREAEEELREPSIDASRLPSSKYDLDWLLTQIGKGDRFVSEDVQTGTQYGDYRVDTGVMMATGYNDYLARMTRRIADALRGGPGGGGMTRSAKTYNEITRFPFLQVRLPTLTGWIDTYIRTKLFDVPFDPLDGESWRVLLLDDVARHIAGSFATALIESEGNQPSREAEVHYRSLSEVATINVRSTSCVSVAKAIYPKLPVPSHAGGLERTFMLWTDQDTAVEALIKIDPYKHSFLRRRYLKVDGMPAMYSPDFLVRTSEHLYIVETKAQRDLTSANVIRKQLAAVAWCEQLNYLEPEQRGYRDWHYVIIGEDAVKEWRAKNGRSSELLEYARLRRKGPSHEQERLL